MTDQTKFKLLAIFKQMKKKINTSSFDKRLILQKTVYLLQESGLELGNAYGWYLRGPYSRDTANDGFQLEKIQNHNHVDIEPLKESEKRKIEKFEAFTTEAQKLFKDESEVYRLEMLASLHFVLNHGFPKPKTEKDALKMFAKLKPEFSLNSKKALKLLKKYYPE